MSSFWSLFRQSRYGPWGLAILALVVGTALLAPHLAGDPFALGDLTLAPPSRAHPLGTDHLGRDVWSMTVYGSRVSLVVGITAALVSAGVGIALGAVAGYFGGWVDEAISKITDVFLMTPTFFLILIVVVMFGNSMFYVMLVIGLTIWPANARLMRAQALTLRERTFTMAARALGDSSWRILLRHIIPNGIYPVIANTTLQMAGAILTEAGLSFLGLGDPNTVSWGQMIYTGRPYLVTAPWVSFFPGLAIVITVMGFYFVGDGLNYALNPRFKERQG